MKRRVIVFGSSGFIGSSVARRLSDAGMSVTGSGSADCNLLKIAPVRVRMRAAGPGTTVVFCAGLNPAPGRPENRMWDNVRMVRSFLSAIPPRGLRSLIFLSSTSVYGRSSAGGPVREGSAVGPDSPYGLSKLVCEELIRLEPLCQSFPVAILRPSIVYGPGDRFRSLIGRMYAALKRDRFVSLDAAGRRCDFVHVEDLARLVETLVRKPYDGILNVVSGEGVPASAAARRMAEALGFSAGSWRLKAGRSGGRGRRFDNRRLRSLFPRFCFRPLETGIREYCAQS